MQNARMVLDAAGRQGYCGRILLSISCWGRHVDGQQVEKASLALESMVIGYILTFVSGALILGIVELLLLWCFLRRLRHQKEAAITALPSFSIDADAISPTKISIEGDMWVASVSPLQLESAIKTSNQNQKLPKDRKQKKDVEQKPEISVALKHAKIQDRNLVLTSTDGTSSSIQLEGCSVMAVSSTMLATRKWAKKYPIKLEHKSRALLGTTICLLYFKTGWEKESWCEALRVAARENDPRNDWYSKLKYEFEDYVNQLKNSYPDIFRTGSGSGKRSKGATATKKSVSWKRLLKKKTKGDGARTKAVTVQAEEVKPDDSVKSNNSLTAEDFESLKWESDANNQSDTNTEPSSSGKRAFVEHAVLGSADLVTDALNAKALDGAVAGLNILFSRLFFDLYHSSAFVSSIQRRIQNLLSRISTLSYITPITCTRIDIGKSPPLVHGLRALPIAEGVWGVEADLEYTGGIVLTLETRLDIGESRAEQKQETSSAGAATADIISKSLETVEDDLEIAGEASAEQADQGSSKGTNRRRWGQWKAFLSSVADQVSQVPLTLSMRVVSLKGTMQFRVRATPSDRIWYGFSSMPAMELVPEPCVGDHKITTGPLLAYIAERIQVLVSETMVFPNCEDIYVPWMVSDEHDWLQETAVPFPHEPKQQEKSKQSSDRPQGDNRGRNLEASADGGISELKRPLLDKKPEADQPTLTNQDAAELGGNEVLASADDGESSSRRGADEQKRRRGVFKREKMLSLGKKFEEKTRQFAERMRERFEKE